jgi:hypothetical protein
VERRGKIAEEWKLLPFDPGIRTWKTKKSHLTEKQKRGRVL